MPTREEAMAEAYRRGLMPPQQRAAYEEAQRRGLVKAPSALDRANAFVNQNINPVLMTFNRNALPFMDEAADALQAASNLAQGRAKTPAEAWTQARSASKSAVLLAKRQSGQAYWVRPLVASAAMPPEKARTVVARQSRAQLLAARLARPCLTRFPLSALLWTAPRR